MILFHVTIVMDESGILARKSNFVLQFYVYCFVCLWEFPVTYQHNLQWQTQQNMILNLKNASAYDDEQDFLACLYIFSRMWVGIDVFPFIFVGICMKAQEWLERKIFRVLERSFILQKNPVSWCAEQIKRSLFSDIANKTSICSLVLSFLVFMQLNRKFSFSLAS